MSTPGIISTGRISLNKCRVGTMEADCPMTALSPSCHFWVKLLQVSFCICKVGIKKVTTVKACWRIK